MTRRILALTWDILIRVCGVSAAILMVYSTLTHDFGMATYYGVIVLMADRAVNE